MDRRQGQKIKDEGEGEGNRREGRKGGGKRYLSQREWDKGLPLDREETELNHRQMVVYKDKRETLVLG